MNQDLAQFLLPLDAMIELLADLRLTDGIFVDKEIERFLHGR